MSQKTIKLREIPFGTPISDPDGCCIYARGHIDKAEFLGAVKASKVFEVPEDAREALTIDDVEYIRFRPMSPSEARGHGLTWGVMETDEGGYAVTAVKV